MIRLLCEPHFETGTGTQTTSGLGSKGFSVLAILAAAGAKGIRRERIAAMVWPNRDDLQAKSTLRQVLTAIRKALADLPDVAIETSGDVVCLSAPDQAVDIRLFDAAGPAITRGKIGTERAKDLAALYRGEFMSGFSFDGDLLAHMLSFRQRYHDYALMLAEHLSQQPDALDEAERLAKTLVSIDPAAEEAYRALIRVALAHGKRNRALKHLTTLKSVLLEELGADPETETLALLDGAEQDPPAAEAPVAQPAARPANADAPATVNQQPSIAILPFVDISPSGNDFLADGLVNEITVALSQMREFFVIARQSAYAYKDRFIDAREAGAALGARYIIDGTVQRVEARVRLHVQLVDATTGTMIWARRFDSDCTDMLDLQLQVARQVAGAILPSVRNREIERTLRHPPGSLNAYGFVLRAYPKFWAHRRAESAEAIELLGAAIDLEPTFGLAHALKAWCHAQTVCYLWSETPETHRAAAIDHARIAAEHCGEDATALAAIGAAYSMVTRERELARHFIDCSLAIDPCNAWAWMRDGWLHVLGHDPKKGLESFAMAEGLSPLDPFMFNVYFGQPWRGRS
jgi:TolB-like protein